MAVMVLLKLTAYTSENRYRNFAENALLLMQPALAQGPTGFAW
jgi:hypothetical protein